MKVSKKVISHLTKCYSIAPLKYNGKDFFLVAAEKEDRCILFDLDGNEADTVWKEPGGVMSMVQVSGSNGQFLATHKFYSPNNSKEAKIVVVTPDGRGNWGVKTLTKLPHVHRFDIVQRDGIKYLIACTLKSGHEYKDDWSMPGKVYAAKLPEDLSVFDEAHPLELMVLKSNMLKNHGYTRNVNNGVETAIISCEEGVFRFIPPANGKKDWKIETLIHTPASDAVLIDMDKDGEEELCILSPFHGEKISIYKKQSGDYEKIYDYPENAEFVHAIYGGDLCGVPTFVIGHRKGEQNLIALWHDSESMTYQSQVLDTNCGSANVYHYVMENQDIIISANRERDEVAMYILHA